ncbi:hypothetical protein ACVWYN_000929 [Pedobacter sp. UYP24]
MEPFDILVTINEKEKSFLVIPSTDEDKFHLFYGLQSLGHVIPKLTNGVTTWSAENEISDELLVQIADEIVRNIIKKINA